MLGISSAIAYLTPATYSAEAVLVVPAVTEGTLPPGNPDAAAKLAKTYAALIPLNSALIQEAATKTRVDPAYLANNLTATNDSGTGIVRLNYVGTDPNSAAQVLHVIVLMLTGSAPPAPVDASSLNLITAPTSVTRSGGDITRGSVFGGVLGLVVALAAAFALERTAPHADGPTEVAEVVRVPVTTWNAPTTLGVTRLLRSWGSGPPGRGWQVALVPVGKVGHPQMLDVVSGVGLLHRTATESESAQAESDPGLTGLAGINGAGGGSTGRNGYAQVTPLRITVVDLLGGDDIHRLEIADTIVLVIASGVSLSLLGSTTRRLRNQGAAPVWSIFIPGRGTTKASGRVAAANVVRHGDV